MPEFVYSAHKFKSRVFSWLTLIDLSLCFTFFAASFYFNAPLFYLLLFGFSGVLIAAKSLLRNFAALSLFLREAWLFIQLNLIITSLFAVFSYNSAYLYSINIIAAAILFFALSARERLFGYDYVAALLFNLGLVMLARDFHNTGMLYLMIAAAGVIFTCAAVAMRGDGKKSSRFNLIGSVTAGIGSVYIALAMLVYGQKGGYMLVGLIALCVMLGDMIYLSIRNKIQFLGTVVPLFAFVTLYQGLAVIEHYWVFPYDKAYLLAMSVVIFAAFYIFNNIKSFRAAKISGAMIALLNLVILFFICIYPRPLLISLPLIGLVFTAMLYVI
jgi:hypothetical protein